MPHVTLLNPKMPLMRCFGPPHALITRLPVNKPAPAHETMKPITATEANFNIIGAISTFAMETEKKMAAK